MSLFFMQDPRSWRLDDPDCLDPDGHRRILRPREVLLAAASLLAWVALVTGPISVVLWLVNHFGLSH